MYVVIIGSGRTGSRLAGLLSKKGHDVVVIDQNNRQFRRLPVEFSGFKVEGDALEHEILDKAKMQNADIIVVTTGNDKVNYMVAQMARILYSVSSVLVRVIDPEKEELFVEDEGIETFSPLSLLVNDFIDRIKGE